MGPQQYNKQPTGDKSFNLPIPLKLTFETKEKKVLNAISKIKVKPFSSNDNLRSHYLPPVRLLENLFVGGTTGSTCFGYPWA
ncbi:hypothetical protein AKJ36_00720 [candidate division MSBL1 archaeon SCGC-AAA259I07]|uniref:Uncharacterized protein n=1 Tax=candidate division MSBL1 archaeon SCGC-AAA259I07 TaxID=1698266 RepID=A0A133UMD3_9EURY|nr:hypothetical protein AKJ36_00720 [candidate division MSBL1 archaeon SCGC-AAA259I07]